MGSSDLMIGVVVVGGLAAAGWCFFMGPCKEWLSGIGGEVVEPTEATEERDLSKVKMDKKYVKQRTTKEDRRKIYNHFKNIWNDPDKREKGITLIAEKYGISRNQAKEWIEDNRKELRETFYTRSYGTKLSFF